MSQPRDNSLAKPAVLIVPGAWHYPSHYSHFASLLESAGHHVQSVDLPAVSQCPQPNFNADINIIRDAITTLADAGHNIIVFTHSYGSIPAYNATRDLDRGTRSSQGKSGGVVHIVFCAAFIVPVGKSLIGAFGGNDLPWFKVNAEKTIVHPDTPEQIFYNDLNATQQKDLVATLGPFSYQCYYSEVTHAGYRDVPCTYVYTEKDNAIPLQIQKGMVESAEGKWRTVTLETGHSPFLGKPEECVKIIGGIDAV